MNAADRLYLQFEGAIHGPYTSAQMRELAEGTLITPRTLAALAPGGPWQSLEATPHHADIFPTRSALGFKPTAFEDLNKSGTPPREPPMPIPSAEKNSVLALKSREPGASPAPFALGNTPATDAPPNDIRQLVNEVGEIERRIAPPVPLRRPWRMSGRLKLVLALAVLGNGVVFSIPIFYDASDYLSVAVLRGWLVIYNGGLAVIFVQLPKD